MHPTLASVLVAKRVHCVTLSVVPPAVVLIQVVATNASSIMLSVQMILYVNLTRPNDNNLCAEDADCNPVDFNGWHQG